MEINITKIKDILKKFSQKKIYVIGDIMLDEYVSGDVIRISPEAPVPVLQIQSTTHTLGGAGNTANNLKALGATTYISGVIGSDDHSLKVIDLLKRNNIYYRGVIKDKKRKTTVKSRIMALNQQLLRIDSEDPDEIDAVIQDSIYEDLKKHIAKIDIIIVSDYAKGVVTEFFSQRIITLARKYNKPVLIDPKGHDFTKYHNAHIITPNLRELGDALRIPIQNIDKVQPSAELLCTQTFTEAILVTMGENGMALMQKNGDYVAIPAADIHVVDVSGAGDTAIAAFAIATASGATYTEAMFIATIASGLAIQKQGTATITIAELEAGIESLHLNINLR